MLTIEFNYHIFCAFRKYDKNSKRHYDTESLGIKMKTTKANHVNLSASAS